MDKITLSKANEIEYVLSRLEKNYEALSELANTDTNKIEKISVSFIITQKTPETTKTGGQSLYKTANEKNLDISDFLKIMNIIKQASKNKIILYQTQFNAL